MILACGSLLANCAENPDENVTQDSELTSHVTVIPHTDTIVHEPESTPDLDLANQTPLDSMRFVRAVSINHGLVNPLNALSYVLPDGSPFFDIVTLEEASFHEMSDHNPDLWGGGPDYEKFVKPLQDKGIKVLLTIRSGSGRWGFANLTDAQIEDLATQIHEEVMKSKLNGVNLVDLGADYDDAYQPRPNDTSYSKMILALREKLSDKRVITLRHVGYSSTLSQEAVKAIDRAWLFSGGATVYSVPAGAPEFPNRKWAPMRIPVGNRQSSLLQTRIKINTRRALADEMGAIAFHLLDTVDVSTTLTPVAQAIYGDSVIVTRTRIYYKE